MFDVYFGSASQKAAPRAIYYGNNVCKYQQLIQVGNIFAN